MPESVDDFYHLLKTFFPTVYDIKYLIKDLKNLKDSGLSKLAAELRVFCFLKLNSLIGLDLSTKQVAIVWQPWLFILS